MNERSQNESQETASGAEGDVETDVTRGFSETLEDAIDRASPDSAALDDEIGIAGTQATGGLAGDAG